MDQHNKKLDLLRNQAHLLHASFDAVQIIVSRYDEESGDTETYAWGEGNFHTRSGMVREWLMKHQLPDLEDDMDEDGE